MQRENPCSPTFLMIGCQRCGTTWTDAALREHPEVFLPEAKQSYFFDRNYEKGIDWYLERFQGSEGYKAIGEVATGYCLLESIPLMHQNFPDIQLMMVMRNPIHRAYSNYQARKVESGWTSFANALEREPDLLTRGEYIDQLEMLFKYYSRDQVLPLFYEELNRDDEKYLKSILNFLNVDSKIRSNLYGQRKNAAMFPALRRQLHRVGLKPAVNLISKSPIGVFVRKRRKVKGATYAKMDEATFVSLQKHFHPFNNRLAKFLNRDLSHWDRN